MGIVLPEAKQPGFRTLLTDCIPSDAAGQTHLMDLLEALAGDQGSRIEAILDLGCGDGRHLDLFRRHFPTAGWIGADVAESPEVATRKRRDGHFLAFDGVNIPLRTDAVDLVFSNQVFEHVRHPDALLQEVARVLRPGGLLLGSTSQFEPYHSYSLWNYTVYGFRVLLEDAGLRPVAFHPGIDALTLIARAGFGRRRFFDRWWRKQSPLHAIIGGIGRLRRLPPREIAAAKLFFSGQFSFTAVKPAPDETTRRADGGTAGPSIRA